MNVTQTDKITVNQFQDVTDAKKKKVLCAIQLSNRGKVKRFYAFKIPDYSSKSLRTIFDKHIDKTAYITTDEWKGIDL